MANPSATASPSLILKRSMRYVPFVLSLT
jgi:hypothetical protein